MKGNAIYRQWCARREYMVMNANVQEVFGMLLRLLQTFVGVLPTFSLSAGFKSRVIRVFLILQCISDG